MLGDPSMNIHPWISIHGYRYRDILVWISMYGYPRIGDVEPYPTANEHPIRDLELKIRQE